MTELQLYKFLDSHELEYRWEKGRNNQDEFLVWIPFYLLEDFTDMIGYNYFSDGGVNVNLQESYICLDITDIAEYHDINLENILEKEVN